MNIQPIIDNVNTIEDDCDKVIMYSRIIDYVEKLQDGIGFTNSEIQHVNIINTKLKNEIDFILEDVVKQITTQIKFLLYCNNETRHNNRNSRNS